MGYSRESRPTKTIHKHIIGSYRKRNVTVVNHGEEPVAIRIDPHWSGGTKDEWTFLRRNGTSWVHIGRGEAGITTIGKRRDGSPLVGLAGPLLDVVLCDGVIAVRTGWFCGKTAVMGIHVTDETVTWINR